MIHDIKLAKKGPRRWRKYGIIGMLYENPKHAYTPNLKSDVDFCILSLYHNDNN
jgi:hypothetical protein